MAIAVGLEVFHGLADAFPQDYAAAKFFVHFAVYRFGGSFGELDSTSRQV